MAERPNEPDVEALINDIKEAIERLKASCARPTESPMLQGLQKSDHQRLLVVAQDLVSAVEPPEVTALQIAKGVRSL